MNILSRLIQGFLPHRHKPAKSSHEVFAGHDLLGSIRGKAEYLRQTGYIDYPFIVHMETIAVCNATCDFCPYQSLERKGIRMSDQLIEKIIDDLTAIPKNISFCLAPYKVSDPFLESRLFDILGLVNEKLPNANIGLITNGSALTAKKLERLGKIKNISYIYLSLNYMDADDYERVMGIPFAKTMENLDRLHVFAASGKLNFPIQISRVSENKAGDIDFVKRVRNRYPAFSQSLIYRNDWIGDVKSIELEGTVPDAPCHRWFDLSITATGEVAKCCMDAEARYSHGNVKQQHALDIYRQSHLRALRETLPSRLAAGDPCSRCTYLNFP